MPIWGVPKKSLMYENAKHSICAWFSIFCAINFLYLSKLNSIKL